MKTFFFVERCPVAKSDDARRRALSREAKGLMRIMVPNAFETRYLVNFVSYPQEGERRTGRRSWRNCRMASVGKLGFVG